MMLCSPALQRHIAAGARVLDWGGWQGPAIYTSLDEEVKQVRSGVGLADYPFLSHYMVAGQDALATLERACTRDLARCEPGRSCYTLMLDANGRPIDDGVVMRIAPERFIVTVPGRKPTSFASGGFFDVKHPESVARRRARARGCRFTTSVPSRCRCRDRSPNKCSRRRSISSASPHGRSRERA